MVAANPSHTLGRTLYSHVTATPGPYVVTKNLVPKYILVVVDTTEIYEAALICW